MPDLIRPMYASTSRAIGPSLGKGCSAEANVAVEVFGLIKTLPRPDHHLCFEAYRARQCLAVPYYELPLGDDITAWTMDSLDRKYIPPNIFEKPSIHIVAIAYIDLRDHHHLRTLRGRDGCINRRAR